MASDNPPEDWPGGLSGSRSCLTGTHADCGHLARIGYNVRDGGRPSLLLCQCRCHSACPLASRLPFVSRASWEARCTCPGTELAAGKLDESEPNAPDFSDFERRWHEHWEKAPRDPWQLRAAKREALEAARTTGAGKSRAQIREIYVGPPPPRAIRSDAGRDRGCYSPQQRRILHGLHGTSARRNGPGLQETFFGLRSRVRGRLAEPVARTAWRPSAGTWGT
jgi:hypothetical protein